MNLYNPGKFENINLHILYLMAFLCAEDKTGTHRGTEAKAGQWMCARMAFPMMLDEFADLLYPLR